MDNRLLPVLRETRFLADLITTRNQVYDTGGISPKYQLYLNLGEYESNSSPLDHFGSING